MQEITKNVYLVQGANKGHFPYSNAVLLTGGMNVLIDAGCGLEVLKRVNKMVSLDRVIYSHGHPDHCSGCWYFPSEILWGPKEMKTWTGNLMLMAERFIAPQLREAWMTYLKREMSFRDFRAAHFFDRNDRFDFGTITLEPLPAPGHTNDHYCFYLPKQKIMLTTDVDFTSFGPWYSNPESDIDQFIASIEALKTYDVDTLVSSHMGVIKKNIGEHFDHYLQIFYRRERRILEFLQSPKTLEHFADKALIYGRYVHRPAILRFWERQMIEKHLKRLCAANAVQEKNGTFHRTGKAQTILQGIDLR